MKSQDVTTAHGACAMFMVLGLCAGEGAATKVKKLCGNGRHKLSDVELCDEEKPANAHNAVTNITKPDGTELKLVRANMPFATPSKGEFGTYFIGYAGTFSTTSWMLRNMFIGNPMGNTDRLLDFSTALTGTLFFVPSRGMLEELAE